MRAATGHLGRGETLSDDIFTPLPLYATRTYPYARPALIFLHAPKQAGDKGTSETIERGGQEKQREFSFH